MHAVGLLVNEKLGWIFREQPVSDYGIDAHIEVTEPDRSLKGRLLGVQIKSGPSFFSEPHSYGWVYRGVKKHLDYWLRHVLPVIVVLHDPESGESYWQSVTPETISETDKAWKLIVPKSQRLDADAADVLRELTDTAKEPHQRRLAQFLVEKPLMDILESGKRLLLYVEEWVNKTSGRGSLRLFTVDDDGEEDVVKDWPFVFFGFRDYADALRELFPWASLSIDEEFYDDYEAELYRSTDYGAPKFGMPTIRPYEIASNEVAIYRLELTLNDLGRAFLTLEPFLIEGRIPIEIDEWCEKCGERLNEDVYCSKCYAEAEEAWADEGEGQEAEDVPDPGR